MPVINFNPAQSSGSPVHDATVWAQANGIDPAAVLSIIAFEGGPSTNENCGGGATCSGYFQLNNSLYAGQYTPGNVFSELAVPGVGDRIYNTLQSWGDRWKQDFAGFWVAAQGGNPAGVPADQFARAVNQGVAWAGGAPFQGGAPGAAGGVSIATGGGTLSDFFAGNYNTTPAAVGGTSLAFSPGGAAVAAAGAIPGVGFITGLFGGALKKLLGLTLDAAGLRKLGAQVTDVFTRGGIFFLGMGVIFVGAIIVAQRSQAVQAAERDAVKGAIAA